VRLREDAECFYLALELCNGGDLLGKRFQGAALQLTSLQLLAALAHVHRLGIIHRDIKQENILLKAKSSLELKVADFGCACRLDACTAPAGTRRLMAPELLMLGERPCFKADVWSSGYVLHALASGRLPDCCLTLVNEGLSAVPSFEVEVQQEGPRFQSFLQMLLREQRSERCSARDALQHPYLLEM
jgi:serine/threonine protein kinase